MDLSAHFTDKETRVLGGEVTFLRSHTGATLLVSVEVGRLGAEPKEVLGAVSLTSRSSQPGGVGGSPHLQLGLLLLCFRLTVGEV